MNSRERFWATTHFGKRDRMFHMEFGPFEETIERWRKEGLPEDSDWCFYGGYDRYETVPLNPGLCPPFKREKISEDMEFEIYRDTDGVIKRKIKDMPEPAMPQYLEYPLKGREQWPIFKKKLNPDGQARFPLFWESMKKQYIQRDFPLGISGGSLYGWLRNWMGFEGLSYALYDDRAFVEQAVEAMADCILGLLDKGLVGIDYDFAVFWEDMAYKTGPLISPRHYREIFVPHYRRITDRLRRAGIDTMMLDSDGNVETLIPIWIDLGINYIYPMEVAAGMDVIALRKKYGKTLIMGGGMDKRIMARDKPAIKQMVEEKIPLMQEGGYVPGCDHAIPQDIPWENYLYYRELLSKVSV